MLMDASVLGGRAEVLALQVESFSPGLLRLARHRASGECGHSAGFWPQGQYNHRTPLVAGRRAVRYTSASLPRCVVTIPTSRPGRDIASGRLADIVFPAP